MRVFFFCFLTWIHFEYCVSYSIGHLQICFLDQKNPILRFLNFPKFEYCFLYSVSYIPILSVLTEIGLFYYLETANLFLKGIRNLHKFFKVVFNNSVFGLFSSQVIKRKNGILLSKLFWPTVKKKVLLIKKNL